jgi:hypothetical protein
MLIMGIWVCASLFFAVIFSPGVLFTLGSEALALKLGASVSEQHPTWNELLLIDFGTVGEVSAVDVVQKWPRPPSVPLNPHLSPLI